MARKIQYFGEELKSYKAALHMHSTVSDGVFSPEEAIALYEKKGYEVYAFTDHRKTNPVSSYRTGMTLLSGMEIHPRGPHGTLWHIVALGIPESFKNREGISAQKSIDRVIRAGGVCLMAHPHWSGQSSADVAALKNLSALEVFNSECRYIGRAYNTQLRDELLNMGIRMPAVCVDDMHRKESMFLGWTMVLAGNRSEGAVMDAIRRGRMYATQGPEIHRMELKDGIFHAEFSPCVEIIVKAAHGAMSVKPSIVPDVFGEKEYTSFSAEISEKDFTPENIFHLQLRDKRHRYAWSSTFTINGI